MSKYIYFSAQQTFQTGKEILKLLEDTIYTIYTSEPDFNLPKTQDCIDIWIGIDKIKINEPCYGNIVEDTAKFAEKYGYKVERDISKFVLEKSINNSKFLLNALISLNYLVAFDRLSQFVDGLNNILTDKVTVQGLNGWNEFLKKYNLDPEMELNLDLYLLNFDNTLTPDDISKIFSFSIDLKNKSRWLTKVGYHPIGCFTDVRNFISVLEKTNGKIPDVLFIDCENDDIATFTVLEKLHKSQGTKMKLFIQLPIELEYKYRHALDLILDKILFSRSDITFIFDPNSKNLNVLRDFYKF